MAADIVLAAPSAPSSLHALPQPFNTTPPSSLHLITQGAEALLYRTPFLHPNHQIALKYRPRKSYRHALLDARLTKQRLVAEARVLVRCRREAVPVPAVLAMDWDAGWIALEWIPGATVRACLDRVLAGFQGEVQRGMSGGEALWGMMGRIGGAVGGLHRVGVTHGDLTTSNLMVRDGEDAAEGEGKGGSEEGEGKGGLGKAEGGDELGGEIVIIDFGLAVQTVQDEDRAVDLYVLERAFGSTHPQAEGLFKEVLRSYGESYSGAKAVLKRLDDVRQRGRKKSMVG